MNDDSLKNLFKDFNPPLSGNLQFMSRLRQGMDSVELVKAYNRELRRRNKKAVAIAAAVGFICGVIFSLFLPAIGKAIGEFRQTLPDSSMLYKIAELYLPIILILIAGASAFIAVNTYELSLFLMKRKD